MMFWAESCKLLADPFFILASYLGPLQHLNIVSDSMVSEESFLVFKNYHTNGKQAADQKVIPKGEKKGTQVEQKDVENRPQ